MRIGLFGGTFNPIHFGHLNSAKEIAERFKLDRVIFIPALIPPHKREETILMPKFRMDMIRLAIRSNNRLFKASSIELKRGGASYSIETINRFKQQFNKDTSFYFIIGMDVFQDIATWKDVQEFIVSCNFIVNNRPNYIMDDDILGFLAHTFTLTNIRFKQVENHVVSIHNTPYYIYLTKTTLLDISSSSLRKMVINGLSIKYLVPPEVEEYIKKNRLYI